MRPAPAALDQGQGEEHVRPSAATMAKRVGVRARPKTGT